MTFARSLRNSESNPMDNRLLDILVCPICKGPLEYHKPEQELVCPRDRLAYPIRDGIPVMIEEDARRLAD